MEEEWYNNQWRP